MVFSNFHKNCMGTLSFDACFKGMRKSQDFCVYPLEAGASSKKIKIQSDTRIGEIDMITGEVLLSPSVSSGAYFHHLALAKPAPTLSTEELEALKSQVGSTASAKAGSYCITCDNSGAVALLS